MSASGNTNIIKHPVGEDGRKTVGRPAISGTVVKQQVVEAQAEARRIVTEAEEYAARVRASVDDMARESREAAYREGYEESLLEFNNLLIEARERRDMALGEIESDLLRLAVKLAERIIGRELERDDRTIAGIVATALEAARQHETLTVRVNPIDIRAVHAHREQFDATGRARLINIVADHRVRSGGCIIESEAGTIDAQLETQLRVLERVLLARAAGEQP